MIYDENSLLGVKVILMNETAKKPTRGTNYSAGYDLYASVDETITYDFPRELKVRLRPNSIAAASTKAISFPTP